jgi:hypothetical protein
VRSAVTFNISASRCSYPTVRVTMPATSTAKSYKIQRRPSAYSPLTKKVYELCRDFHKGVSNRAVSQKFNARRSGQTIIPGNETLGDHVDRQRHAIRIGSD